MNVRRKRFSEAATKVRNRVTSRALLVVTCIAIIAFGIGYGVTAMAFTAGGGGADVALVPDVRELTIADAERRLTRAGFSMIVSDSFPNLDVPEGAVLAQTPLPGQEVSAGAEVSIIVSTGLVRPFVPDVSTMTMSTAVRVLEAAGFDVVTEEVPGEGEPGMVIEPVPASGTPLPLPATVRLRVGANPLFLNVPILVGLPEDSAVVSLEALGFRVGQIRYESTETAPPYRVLAQDPAPGDSVDFASEVRILVSMPSVESPPD